MRSKILYNLHSKPEREKNERQVYWFHSRVNNHAKLLLTRKKVLCTRLDLISFLFCLGCCGPFCELRPDGVVKVTVLIALSHKQIQSDNTVKDFAILLLIWISSEESILISAIPGIFLLFCFFGLVASASPSRFAGESATVSWSLAIASTALSIRNLSALVVLKNAKEKYSFCPTTPTSTAVSSLLLGGTVASPPPRPRWCSRSNLSPLSDSHCFYKQNKKRFCFSVLLVLDDDPKNFNKNTRRKGLRCIFLIKVNQDFGLQRISFSNFQKKSPCLCHIPPLCDQDPPSSIIRRRPTHHEETQKP